MLTWPVPVIVDSCPVPKALYSPQLTTHTQRQQPATISEFRVQFSIHAHRALSHTRSQAVSLARVDGQAATKADSRLLSCDNDVSGACSSLRHG
jgi:hypothetical protein